MSAGKQEEAIACQEFVEIVTDYLEGQLAEAERRWTDEHLAACDACRAYLDQMRATIAALRALEEQDLEPDKLRSILGAMESTTP